MKEGSNGKKGIVYGNFSLRGYFWAKFSPIGAIFDLNFPLSGPFLGNIFRCRGQSFTRRGGNGGCLPFLSTMLGFQVPAHFPI
jgi:hypothetical protein